MRIRHLVIPLACAALVALAMLHRRWLPATYDPTQPLDLRADWTVITPLKLRLLSGAPDLCRAALRTSSLPMQEHAHSGTAACPLQDVLTVGGRDIPLDPASFLASCNLAVRWSLFETRVVGPVTQQVFHTGIGRIRHVGSFACRDVRDRPGAQSSHATADAIDVSAFILADGREIPVVAWSQPGPRGLYLHRLRDGACPIFGTVLSPDYNSLHAAHFHLQATGFGLCR
ncbi:extensin-like domain-containing protein [Gluconacetobacter takamatsuzukensis]|uniref:Extensin family protein n=1 Tax=Gluconacetobacter takamatsuzukensis TaxID=1286190 RepID=A0A7W4KBI2_9PROT|nr:extensin family protein [Gluconacetobacter takamatsuzukensis]MBB2203882.1 extensin family protein [Gluconacetobacter takamatsuzukensis]